MLSRVEHEKSSITSGPVLSIAVFFFKTNLKYFQEYPQSIKKINADHALGMIWFQNVAKVIRLTDKQTILFLSSYTHDI